MNGRAWLLILATTCGTSACVVSSFEVSDNANDTDSGGKSSGGTQATAGHGGSAKAGTTAAGGTTAEGGTTTAGGTTAIGGQLGLAGDDNGGAAPDAPYRVGFTEFHDSASGSDQASAGL